MSIKADLPAFQNHELYSADSQTLQAPKEQLKVRSQAAQQSELLTTRLDTSDRHHLQTWVLFNFGTIVNLV